MASYSLRAEQKIRQALTGNPFIDPVFQHEGSTIVRWLTGGTTPSIYAYFHKENDMTILYCPWCKKKLGQFSISNPQDISSQLTKIRESGSQHQQQHTPSNTIYTP